MEATLSWNYILYSALAIPGVKVDRDEYLDDVYAQYRGEEGMSQRNPVEAFGIEVADVVARKAIRNQTFAVTAISAVAGLPGGIAVLGTIPADISQYCMNLLMMAQKLGYIYGWPALYDESGKFDDQTINILTLFVGVMFGSEAATKTYREAFRRVSQQVTGRFGPKIVAASLSAPVVKQLAKWIGIKITKDVVAKQPGRFVPLFGGLMSGKITYSNFKPCAERLREVLHDQRSNLSSESTSIFESVDESLQDDSLELEYIRIAACINMALIDGVLSPEEKNTLDTMIEEADLTDDRKTFLRAQVEVRKVVPLGLSRIRDNELYRTMTLEHLALVVQSDGKVAPMEKIYIYKIADELGVKRSDARRYIKKAKKKV